MLTKDFGIALYNPINLFNVGGVLRNAHVFGASFVSIIKKDFVYKRMKIDTTNATKHLSFKVYDCMQEFLEDVPNSYKVLGVETYGEIDLPNLIHPKKCVYVFGPENGSLPASYISPQNAVKIDTKYCLNLSTTTGIVCYDRTSKELLW